MWWPETLIQTICIYIFFFSVFIQQAKITKLRADRPYGLLEGHFSPHVKINATLLANQTKTFISVMCLHLKTRRGIYSISRLYIFSKLYARYLLFFFFSLRSQVHSSARHAGGGLAAGIVQPWCVTSKRCSCFGKNVLDSLPLCLPRSDRPLLPGPRITWLTQKAETRCRLSGADKSPAPVTPWFTQNVWSDWEALGGRKGRAGNVITIKATGFGQ